MQNVLIVFSRVETIGTSYTWIVIGHFVYTPKGSCKHFVRITGQFTPKSLLVPFDGDVRLMLRPRETHVRNYLYAVLSSTHGIRVHMAKSPLPDVERFYAIDVFLSERFRCWQCKYVMHFDKCHFRFIFPRTGLLYIHIHIYLYTMYNIWYAVYFFFHFHPFSYPL